MLITWSYTDRKEPVQRVRK